MAVRDLDLKKVSKLTVVESPLYSLVWPYNAAFSHSFSSGAMILPYMIQDLKFKAAKVIVPSKGPFEYLLTSLGIPRDKIILSNSSDFFYSPAATLVLRQSPFNIIQGHWPANSIADIRNTTVKWLIENEFVKATKKNFVVYLSRSGSPQRDVHDEAYLLKIIKSALSPGLELIVFSGLKTLMYGSEAERTSWMHTAEIFIRAVAVIGPHGGAFGNTFFCKKSTTN